MGSTAWALIWVRRWALHLQLISNANIWFKFARSLAVSLQNVLVLSFSYARLQKVRDLIRITSDSWLNNWTISQYEVHQAFPPKNVWKFYRHKNSPKTPILPTHVSALPFLYVFCPFHIWSFSLYVFRILFSRHRLRTFATLSNVSRDVCKIYYRNYRIGYFMLSKNLAQYI